MIELSSSWELEGRRKLSDILFIKEIQLGDQTCDANAEDSGAFGDLAVDASSEFASKSVILRPYQHPEVSSSGACCIMIRLSTQRPLRIIQLVLISSSPHIDFVDRYGEPLARIEGAPVSDGLFRCSSGRLSPHTECVIRFSEMHHLGSLVLQHIGVYTSCGTTSPLSSPTELSEAHTQEIIKLSSFLGSSPRQLPSTISPKTAVPASRSGMRTHGLLNQMRLSKSTTTTATNTPMVADGESQHGMSTNSSSAISEKKEAIVGKAAAAASEDLLYALCDQFLASLYGAQQSTEFWRRCATSLFASLIQLSVGEFASEKRKQDFFQYMQGLLQSAKDDQQLLMHQKQQKGEQGQSLRPRSQSSLLLPSAFSPSCGRSDDSVVHSIYSLSASLNEIRQSTAAQLDEILKRLDCLEEGKKVADLQQLNQSVHHHSM